MKSRIFIDTQKGIFTKYYQNIHEQINEKRVYDLDFPFIPQLLEVNTDPEELFCSFTLINGCNLWDVKNIDFSVIGKIYALLHKVRNKDGKSLCHIDTNPQNILYENATGRYYLIDFVDWRWEYPEFDLIHFMLFWANSKSAEQFVSNFIDFLKGYQEIREISQPRWNSTYLSAINYFDQRRERYKRSEKYLNKDSISNRLLLLKNIMI